MEELAKDYDVGEAAFNALITYIKKRDHHLFGVEKDNRPKDHQLINYYFGYNRTRVRLTQKVSRPDPNLPLNEAISRRTTCGVGLGISPKSSPRCQPTFDELEAIVQPYLPSTD